MIHYLPLERLDMRYTAHLDDAICAYLADKPYLRYYPDMDGRESEPPPPGHFLNARATCEFKARQLADLAQGGWRPNDLIFCADLWFPGIESVAYMEFFTATPVKLRGLIHAGSFTDTDFVRLMERWAAQFENAVLDIADRVYVGSNFARDELVTRRLVGADKVEVTGFPLDPALNDLAQAKDRERIVVFNGRLCDEKQPWLFEAMAERFGSDVQFRWTQKERLSKADYYSLLSRAAAVVSFALQENFGFGILEAVKLGCVPVVPNRLVYPELFDDRYRYETFDDACAMVSAALRGVLRPPSIPDYADSVQRWFA